ncbi:SDR family NAD(P)-dependent oxidoreductase [Gordonia humi]|uniref:3-oxoacyl-[acyl-carrier-protein] reductase MabA n=1 Tax=Gordonia humi TaxID=686429 RepID=A0A840EXP1_9ACTN|nr:SDR family oxidoreductase [Gordonia humi]MBB4133699.1 NAD(P)-dependent dehydrogenase (short-subunit alcohol dehydrogenase family) [Gordonia humi]
MTAKRCDESSAVIVGGSTGVGVQTAIQLAEAGVPRMTLIARSPDRLAAVADQVRDSAGRVTVHTVSADAADLPQITAAIAEAESEMHGIDVLVNSVAGSGVPDLLHELDPASFAQTLRGQLLAPLITSRLVLPGMYARESGSIINIASDAAKVATPGETVLGAGMAGIVMFTRALALEAKRSGVRVNAITPSLIQGTPTTERITREGFSAKLFAGAARQAHLGVVEPADIAALVVFLAGPAAAKLTGQAISVNGGISAA